MDNDTVVSPARAEKKTAEKFVEVIIERRYVPRYCYEFDGDVATLIKDESGDPIEQSSVHIDTVPDKFGQPKKVFREILEHVEPGTKIKIPKSEASRLLPLGVVSVTQRTFD